jgi:phosphatidylglycerophosphate synthase
MRATRESAETTEPDAVSGPARRDPRAAMKTDDGFVAVFFSARIANWLLRRIEDLPIAPNQVTAVAVLTKLAAAAAYATGRWPALVLGAVLVQASFVLDCLDGQLARHRRQTSGFGEWLDFMSDCLGDLVLIAGIAVGCALRSGGLTPFLWSYAAILVLFYRHFDWMLLVRVLGGGYEQLHHTPTRGIGEQEKARVIEAARERRSREWGWFARLLDRLAPKGTVEAHSFTFWVKRALLFGNGERYALISLLGVIDRPEWIFPVLVAWGGVVYPMITVHRWQLFGAR